MFTGLVETLGDVTAMKSDGAGSLLTVAAPFAAELTIGESVAVNGTCLTVVDQDAESFRFQVGPETLRCTNLGELRPGSRVNLERSLRVGDRLGGHLVQGHIDGIGHIETRRRDGDWEFVQFTCPTDLAVQMVPKGSIAVDGVSLTLVEVGHANFSVMLIPHTNDVTTLGFKQPGDAVNLETDLLAKHVWKMMQVMNSTLAGGERLNC